MKQKTIALALGDNETLRQLSVALAEKSIPLFLFNPLIIKPIRWPTHDIPWQTIDKIISISTYAIEHGLKKILPLLATSVEMFTIGEISAKKIQSLWPGKVVFPTPFNSEALLALLQQQSLKNQRIVIFKGIGGRNLLQQALQQQQAIVYTIDCYARSPSKIDLTEHLKKWQHHAVNVLLATSRDSLDAFVQSIPLHEQSWLTQLTLIVTSERLEHIARNKGFRDIIRATNFATHDLLQLFGIPL